MFVFGTALAGPLFVTLRSALIAIVAEAVDVLFEVFGSFVDEATVAVLLTEPVAFDGSAKAEVMVTLWPGVSVPRAQGNDVVQAPLLPAKVVPAGVGSSTVTLAASEGPLFVTVIVNVAFWPATAVPAAFFTIARS